MTAFNFEYLLDYHEPGAEDSVSFKIYMLLDNLLSAHLDRRDYKIKSMCSDLVSLLLAAIERFDIEDYRYSAADHKERSDAALALAKLLDDTGYENMGELLDNTQGEARDEIDELLAVIVGF